MDPIGYNSFLKCTSSLNKEKDKLWEIGEASRIKQNETTTQLNVIVCSPTRNRKLLAFNVIIKIILCIQSKDCLK